MSVQGVVFDSTGSRPLINAVAVAVRIKDSLLLGFARTDASGKFELKNFEVDSFTLTISHPSFDDRMYYILGNQNNFKIEIPNINLQTRSQELDEVIIYANKNPIYYNGDTLVYVADSFAVAENAVVEDLLKKLPGLEIGKDGKIKSQGKDISQVLVDGDEFFGTDPTVATRNLGAKGVQTVEVYEKKVENAADGQETIQVLDLRLKDDAKKGYFGRASMASDFQNFYEGELLLNKFNRNQKISVFVLSANTPKSDFGYGDRNKFGLENEGRNRTFNEDGDIDYSGNDDGVGIPRTLKAGIYYSDKIGKKKQTKIGFNYSYYDVRNDAISRSRSQYFIEDSTFFSDDSTQNISYNQSHSVNLRFESQIDSLTRIEIRPSFTYNIGDQQNNEFATWSNADNVFSRSNLATNSNLAKGSDLSTLVTFDRKFKKPRRQVALNYTLGLNENNSDGNLRATNVLSDTLAQNVASYDQSKVNNQSGTRHDVALSYYEPLNDKFKVQLEYSLQNSNTTQNRETRDFNTTSGRYDILSTIYSNNFDNRRTQNRVGAQLWYESKKHTIHGGLRARNVVIDNRNLVTDQTINQNINNLLPVLVYRYNPTRSKRFSFNYTTNSRQPSISDLQPVPNNTNPNRIQTGNPDLEPDYSHSTNINFNSWNALSGRYIYSGIFGNYTTNAFGDSTSINPFGQQEIRRVNVNNATSMGLFAGGGIPFFNRKLTISPGLNYNYFQTISFINGQQNRASTNTISPNIKVEFELDSLEIEVSADYNYSKPRNSLSTFTTQAFSTQDYYAGVTWRIKKGFRIQTNINYTINGQRSEGYDIRFFIWNAALSKSFLKTENLELTLLANDILNQNINAERFVSQNVVTDNLTRIISRYFLVKLTYRFNNNKTKENDAKNSWY